MDNLNFLFNKFIRWFKSSTDLEKAVVISIVIGIGITTLLIIETKEERFTSLYIYPESYTNYPEGNIISFVYGVKSYEKERTAYDLEIFIGNKLMDKKHFELNPGEVRDEKESIEIPNVKLPVKVRLILKSPYSTYEVHYWLKKPEEIQTPVETPQPTPVLIPAITPTPTPTLAPTSTLVYTNFTTVKIDTISGFSPEHVYLKKVGRVMWINDDRKERRFTLISKEGLFTRIMNIYDRFEYSFNASGTYTFYLKEFPDKKGVVIVSP